MNVVASFVVAVSLVGCATKVQQAHAPSAEEFSDGGSSDMAAAPEKGTKPIIKNDEEVRRECCQQCASGLLADKKGDDPKKIPCSDYTWVLKEECLAFFRKTPMMAVDAQKCAAAPAAKTSSPHGTEQ